MIKKISFIAVASLALLSLPVSAKNLHFPSKGDTMFTVSIPDDWEPEKDEDNVVEANSPQEKVYLAIWELESEKDLKSLGDDINDLLKDHAKNIKLTGEPQAAKPGGMDGLLFSGTAKDKEDGHAIEFFALLVTHNKKAAVIYIEADADAPKDETEKLTKILQSLKPAGS